MRCRSLLLQAMDGYASRITANVTWNSDIGRGFLKLFFTKVLQYHVVTGRCGAKHAARLFCCYLGGRNPIGWPHQTRRQA
jgi:hypothetical protein